MAKAPLNTAGEDWLGEKTEPEVTFDSRVQAAIANAAAEAAKAAAEQTRTEMLALFQSQAGKASDGGSAQDLLNGLALAIAEMNHQGNKRDKPLDPKVLAARRDAMERLYALVAKAKALPKGDDRTPKYRVKSKCNISNTLIMPFRKDPVTKLMMPVDIRWRGEPNDAMEPLNEMAKEISAEFRASRGNTTEYQQEAFKAVWATDGGLIVEGVGPARRQIAERVPESGDLELDADPYDPNAEFVHVLGTIHEPARRSGGL